MRINEAAESAGVTPKNIRYYEKEGLLLPEREQGNRYRSYSEEEVETLKKIRLLRMLDLPIAEIRSVFQGEQSLQGCLKRHLLLLQERRRTIEAAEALCQVLMEEKANLEGLSAETYLKTAEKQQEEGACFVNVKKQDNSKKSKSRGAILGAVVFILLMAVVEGLMIWGFVTDPAGAPPLPLLLLFLAIPAVCIAATLAALYSRLKEIEKGEADDYRNY